MDEVVLVLAAMIRYTKTMQRWGKNISYLLISWLLTLWPVTIFASSHLESDIRTGQDLVQTLELKTDGSVLIDNQPSSKIKLDSLDDRYLVRYKAIDVPNQLVPMLNITFRLPETVSTRQVKPAMIAVHGVNAYRILSVNERTINFNASGIGPEAEITLTVELPKQALKLSPLRTLSSNIQTLSLRNWFAIAIIVPSLMLLYALGLWLYRFRDILVRPASIVLTSPPSTLPPAMVGALIHGYVSYREIAATLIDLGLRGYIDIIYRGPGDFGFGQKRQWQTDRKLQDFERRILEQLFTSSVVSNRTTIDSRLNKHIWSESISQAVEDIYRQMVSLGYFPKNPQGIHLSIRFVGMIIFFCSAIGMAVSLLFFSQQPLVVIPWVVSLIASPIIIQAALLVPRRTEAGRDQAAKWLAFRQFLRAPTNVDAKDAREIFEQYLSYSIVLESEGYWTGYFNSLPVRVPDWYFSQSQYINSYEKLAQTLFGIIGFIGQKFSLSRKPTAI